MKHREPSFFRLSLAVILPLMVLAVISWKGIQSQMRGAWAAARTEADVYAESITNELGNHVAEKYREVAAYPDPPVPQSSASEDDNLPGDHLSALRQLRDDPQAGLSPAGLPRRTLAALRILEIGPERADADAALRIALDETPSILSPLVFDRADVLFKDIAVKARSTWADDAAARKLAGKVDDVQGTGRFVHSQGDVFWLSRQSGFVRYLNVTALTNERKRPGKLPRWAAVQYRFDGMIPPVIYEGFPTEDQATGDLVLAQRIGNGSPRVQAGGKAGIVPEVMGDAPFPWLEGMHVEVTTVDASWIIARAREDAYWTLAALLVAIITSSAGLWLIHRVLARERKLNALKSDFVASVSHELRAPIASIRLMADALEAGKIEQHTAGEFHRLISREGARLSTLIENVLDFARIEQGRKQWHREPSNLRVLLLDTVSLMEPLAAEKSIALVCENFPEQATASIDGDAVRQALVNLLDNALKFSPAGSTVKIRLQETIDHKAWQIKIIDQGCGIAHADQARIFEKFHRLGSELRRESQGTGIGLSLVRAIAEAHAGGIEVQSEAGHGSTFIFTLPIEL